MSYINRDALIKKLFPYDGVDTASYAINAKAVHKSIVEAPTADVAEVRHGENITDMHPVDEFVCSECGVRIREYCRVVIDQDDGYELYCEYEFAYCPHCGAKMDAERRADDGKK